MQLEILIFHENTVTRTVADNIAGGSDVCISKYPSL